MSAEASPSVVEEKLGNMVKTASKTRSRFRKKKKKQEAKPVDVKQTDVKQSEIKESKDIKDTKDVKGKVDGRANSTLAADIAVIFRGSQGFSNDVTEASVPTDLLLLANKYGANCEDKEIDDSDWKSEPQVGGPRKPTDQQRQRRVARLFAKLPIDKQAMSASTLVRKWCRNRAFCNATIVTPWVAPNTDECSVADAAFLVLNCPKAYRFPALVQYLIICGKWNGRKPPAPKSSTFSYQKSGLRVNTRACDMWKPGDSMSWRTNL